MIWAALIASIMVLSVPFGFIHFSFSYVFLCCNLGGFIVRFGHLHCDLIYGGLWIIGDSTQRFLLVSLIP
jgi:hypothetical protein